MNYLLTQEELDALKNKDAKTYKEAIAELKAHLGAELPKVMRLEHNYQSPVPERIVSLNDLKRIIEQFKPNER